MVRYSRVSGGDGAVRFAMPNTAASERSAGDEAEAFESAQMSHARYGSGALRAAVFGFSGAPLLLVTHHAAITLAALSLASLTWCARDRRRGVDGESAAGRAR
jgi:hypothetical protein